MQVQWSMKNHCLPVLYFVNLLCPLVPQDTICFQLSTQCGIFQFIRLHQSTVAPKLIALCAIQKFFIYFFCSRYSALFSMERLLPEWMPRALWVLKEVSLLWQCVDSPPFFYFFEIQFWSIHKPFFWDFLWHVSVGAFPLWAKQWNAWYSCQCFWCTPCSHWLWDSITLSASWGNIFCSLSNSYLVCCCFEL